MGKVPRLPKYQITDKVSTSFETDIDQDYLTVVWTKYDKKTNMYIYNFLEIGTTASEGTLSPYKS